MTRSRRDTDCRICHIRAQERTCADCGLTMTLTDCGHYTQPRPIAAGRADGTEAWRDYCTACARRVATDPDITERS